MFEKEMNNMNKSTNKRNSVRISEMALCGVFAALAYVCVCVFRIKVQFLTLDIKDAIITVGAMIMGPITGVVVSFIVALIEMITISDTSYYGFIMNFLSSATLSVVAALIYKVRRNLFTAVMGLIAAVFSVTSVMMLANLFITPYFMGVPIGTVVSLIPKLLLPFNITKAVLNCAIVMLIYKPISDALRRAGFIKNRDIYSGKQYKLNLKTILVALISIAVIAAALLVFFLVLKANIEVGL